MKWFEVVFVTLILIGSMVDSAYAVGLGRTCSYNSKNAAEVYCIQHGGCPNNGYCYFPDGSNCELRSFYNGTCPGKAYYEQMMWESEAYRFLQGYEKNYYPDYWP